MGVAMRTDFALGHRPTMAEACEAFSTREMATRHYRADTRRSYSYAIQEYLRHAPELTSADQLDLASVQRYAHELEQRGLHGTAQHVKLAAIKAFITYLEDQE